MDFGAKPISPWRVTAVVLGCCAVWLCGPDIAQAAVTFGEMGQNVSENAKGVAKGVTHAGYAAGTTMGVLGFVEMYNASSISSKSNNVYNILIYKDINKNYCPAEFIWTHGHTPKSGVCIGVS